jgi:hypothetical protein
MEGASEEIYAWSTGEEMQALTVGYQYCSGGVI